MTVPVASETAIFAPGSPVPLMLAPFGATVTPGCAGGVISGASVVVAGETLPAPSVCTTFSTSPFACAGTSGVVKLPSAPTVAVPICVPVALVIVTVAPGSPVPVATVPFAATLAVGASGAVASGATMPVAGEALPAGSLCDTDSASPLVRAGLRLTE